MIVPVYGVLTVVQFFNYDPIDSWYLEGKRALTQDTMRVGAEVWIDAVDNIDFYPLLEDKKVEGAWGWTTFKWRFYLFTCHIFLALMDMGT